MKTITVEPMRAGTARFEHFPEDAAAICIEPPLEEKFRPLRVI